MVHINMDCTLVVTFFASFPIVWLLGNISGSFRRQRRIGKLTKQEDI